MFDFIEAKKLESKGKNIIHFEIGDPNFDTYLMLLMLQKYEQRTNSLRASFT